MPDAPLIRGPRFKQGDRVEAVGPGNIHRGKIGVVVEVLQPTSDLIYRYRVEFPDGTVGTFFGFELESESAGYSSNVPV
jgi:hypothetical protein